MALLPSMSKNPIDNYSTSNISNTDLPKNTPEPGGPTKILGTGLTLYQGGVEKTPTGKSNAAISGGVTPEGILAAIKTHQLPTTSNKEFQEELIKRLASTPYGQQKLAEMEATYGKTKSGKFVDNILGARTQFLLNGLDEINKIKEIKENRPAYISTGTADNKLEKILDFGKDIKARDEYWNYFTSKSGKPEMRAYVDSLSKNLAPKGAKYLTSMEQMAPILNYENIEREKYKQKFGHYPPSQKEGHLIVPLTNDKRDEVLNKYLGFKQ